MEAVEPGRRRWRFGSAVLDERTLELSVDGQRMTLERKPLEILRFLLYHAGEVVTKEEILQAVWPGRILSESVLTKAVAKLREALRDDSQELIKTQHGYGYRLMAEVEVEATVAGKAPAIQPRGRASPVARFRHRWQVSAALGAVVVALGVFAPWRRPLPEEPAPSPAIAILQFASLSGPEDAYFSDGTTSELHRALDRIAGLRVTAAAPTLANNGGQQNLQALGRKLGVGAVLTGSVRKSTAQLEVSAQLVNVEGGRPLWAKTYEGTLQDVFAIQEDIVRAVVQKFELEPGTSPDSKLVHQGTSNAAAYDAYLKSARGSGVDHADVQRSIALLQDAVALDPEFVQPHVALAYAYISRAALTAPEDGAALKSAFAAAERALTINPKLAEAHVARGTLLMAPINHFAYQPAIREFKLALALNERSSVAWQQLGAVYTYVGLFDEAEIAARRSVEIQPSDATHFVAAALLIWQGKYAEGLEAMERVPRKTNASSWYWHTTWALLALGRLEEADARIAEFLRNQNDGGGLITSQRAVLHALRGQAAQAEQDIQVAQNADRRFWYFHRTAYGIASAYALMNRRPEALTWLDEALRPEGGFPCYPIPERDRNLDKLRSEPEFKRIMEKSRLLWEHSKLVARES